MLYTTLQMARAQPTISCSSCYCCGSQSFVLERQADISPTGSKRARLRFGKNEPNVSSLLLQMEKHGVQPVC